MAVPIERVKEIQEYFSDLNPYDFDADIFEMEPQNYEPKDWSKPTDDEVNKEKPIPLWFYGISAKRYVLYNMLDGKKVIRKYSLHGMGHIKNPFKKDEDNECDLSA